MTPVLSPGERTLLVAVADRGNNLRKLDVPFSGHHLALLNFGLAVWEGEHIRPTDAGRLVAGAIHLEDVLRAENEELRTRPGAPLDDDEAADQFCKGWISGFREALTQPCAVTNIITASNSSFPGSFSGTEEPPGRYHPAPGVLDGLWRGGDCPRGHEWCGGVGPSGRSIWHESDAARSRFPFRIGVIRPVGRPNVMVSLPADLADAFADEEVDEDDDEMMFYLIRIARDKAL